MLTAKHAVVLLLAAATCLNCGGCVALSFGGKHGLEQSPGVEERLTSLESRVQNLEQRGQIPAVTTDRGMEGRSP